MHGASGAFWGEAAPIDPTSEVLHALYSLPLFSEHVLLIGVVWLLRSLSDNAVAISKGARSRLHITQSIVWLLIVIDTAQLATYYTHVARVAWRRKKNGLMLLVGDEVLKESYLLEVYSYLINPREIRDKERWRDE